MDPIEDAYTGMMNSLVKMLDGTFNIPGQPKEVGFALLIFKFGEIDRARMNYISNAQREDMLCALKEMVAKMEGRAPDTTPPTKAITMMSVGFQKYEAMRLKAARLQLELDILKERYMTIPDASKPAPPMPTVKGVKHHPHKSTTHKEQYAHIHLPFKPSRYDEARWIGGTVFARLEEQGWFASVALCVKGDQFCRRIGRTVARRKFMASKGNVRWLDVARDEVPTYENMKAVYLKECMRMVGDA